MGNSGSIFRELTKQELNEKKLQKMKEAIAAAEQEKNSLMQFSYPSSLTAQKIPNVKESVFFKDSKLKVERAKEGSEELLLIKGSTFHSKLMGLYEKQKKKCAGKPVWLLTKPEIDENPTGAGMRSRKKNTEKWM